jgi:hypothetical protein
MDWLRRLRELCGGIFRREPFPAPADPILLSAVRGWFAEQLLAHPHLPLERRGEYARAAAVVFGRMTPTALLRFRRNTAGITFYLTLEELTVELARSVANVQAVLAQGRTAGGAYQNARKWLHLNGGDEEVEDRDCIALYAHEFSHAVNGPEREISRLKAWEVSWRKEIIPRPLTLRARVSPHEGFAEFGRVLYTRQLTRRYLEREFSGCVEVWRGCGLW